MGGMSAYNAAEKESSVAVSMDTDDENAPLTPEEKRLRWKIDLRIIPYLAPLYLLFNLDRANIAYARLYGIEKALDLTPDQYSMSLAIFHIGYILFEVPSNLLLKMVSPPIWIGFIIITCGISTLCMAAVTNYAGIMATRFFLGLFEAGYDFIKAALKFSFFPGVIYLMGMWYTRQEQGFRIALVSSASTFSGAVAGPIAYAISLMDGVRGLASWQWIFIVEGLPTVILGIFAWWIIPGSPATSSWLNCEERIILLRRLKRAHVEIDGKVFDKDQFIEAIKDYKTYMYILLFLGFIVPTSAVSQLMPTIVKDLGFSSSSTMLLTAPPYIFALLLKMAMAWNSDRTMQRSYHIVAAILLSMAGFVMQAAATGVIPRYIGINLAFAGAISSLPIALSWSNNNMVGATKAPTVVALIIMVGSLGGIVGSQLYKPYEAPRYIPSNLTNIGFLAFSLVVSLALRHLLKKENERMDCRELRLDDSMSIVSSASKDFRFVL